ncbi:hypothetical protein [Gracilibacillus thailandensis]|uniref:Uncharacterized protein n=1 Tax=Gracilibacillus thailandensis TaxID=563735 RepID=A0A6N7R2C2_9BACI|nr:hypothetical protein [Gracilibacillus thailandensis]MRI66759.1 hypothetical protein [Gracilibacillus thailandensis]
MKKQNVQASLNWKLIFILSSIALIRPFLSMSGISEAIGKPFVSITATILITLIWIIVVVLQNEAQPLLTLTFVGIGYGILAIIISGIFSPILTGQLQGPLANPFAIVSVLITNAIWGAIAGAIATAFRKINK